MIRNYNKRIQALNPMVDSGFKYDPNRWNKLNSEAKKLVLKFENKIITRNDVLCAFEDYYIGRQSYLYPFTMTMLWGFADNGYGTYRTNKYLDLKENRVHIQNAFKALEVNNLEEAFNQLMKIKGLNISYVSKLLYFGTRALNYDRYALIFDIRVARALVKTMDVEGVSELLEISPSSKYKNYERYITLIHNWAKKLNVEAENIEMFLFEGDFQG